MSGHDAKFAHRAPSVLANETLAGLCTRRIHRTARAPLRGQQVLLRPQRGDFTAPHKCASRSPAGKLDRSPRRSPRIVGKVLRRSARKGRALIWLERGTLPKVGPRRRRDRLQGEDRDCQVTGRTSRARRRRPSQRTVPSRTSSPAV
jgi:hypothetical protein